MQMSALREIIQAAIDAGMSVREIITEPDGTVRVLTKEQDNTPMLDPLSEARAKRAAKGQGNANRNKAAG